MNVAQHTLSEKIANAVEVLNSGGVIAYPTEHCFGLGCDPQNESAVSLLLKVKQRHVDQGVILIAANNQQVLSYVDLASSKYKQSILESWPGPSTWIIPALKSAPTWVKGKHYGVAVRVTAHTVAKQLCEAYGGAIVSTSANRHGQPSLLNAGSVTEILGDELSYILDEPVGGDLSPSTIRDGMSGLQLR